MLRRGDGANRNPETVEGAVMKSMVRRDGLLLIIDIFQRPLSALTGKCCLIPVFFPFPEVQSFVLLQIFDLIKKPDGDHLRHPACALIILFLWSLPGTPLFSV